MLSLTTQYRQRLWTRDDWSSALIDLGAEMRERVATSAEVAELARLCEAIVPDERVAMELFSRAYASGADEGCGERAVVLALRLGDFASAARIATMRHEFTGDPGALRNRAIFLLDAGLEEAALESLRMALSTLPDDQELRALERAASGERTNSSEWIRKLEQEAQGRGRESAGCLLAAARLARLLPESDDHEVLLMRAFDADPTDRFVYALLENRWVERRQWKRLSNLHHIRSEHATTPLAEVEVYRQAGVRLILSSESPGTGIRLLQRALAIIYQQELERVPQLVAMLGLLTEQLVASGDSPRAIRLLAQALAHPRSTDEAMWVVNRGLKLARGDVALQRTVKNFEALRENLVANEPALLKHDAAAEIGNEMRERENPPGLTPQVADRALVAADVNIAVRAEISTREGKAFAMTRDMSATGLFLACDLGLSLRDEVELSILMPGEDDWSLAEHDLSGVIARVVPGVGYGVRFTKVPDQFLCDLRALCD